MMSENIEDIYKLSPIQHGLLFHSLAEPESGMYCDYVVGDLGAVQPALVIQAWQMVLDRHPILRTAFAWKNLDEPLQIVQRRAALRVQQLDWRVWSPAEQELKLAAYLEVDQRRGFDLATAPLLRLTLIQRADDVVSYICTYHHLLLDGWSFSIVWREVTQCYAALMAGRAPVLEYRRPYRDYLIWLRQQDLSQGKTYWQCLLAGFTVPTPLNIAAPSHSQGARIERYTYEEITLPTDTTADLQALARQQRITASTLIHGAWAVLLSCYSGKDDVVFGSTSSGRPQSLKGSEAMVGLFINTLPLRVQMPPDEPLISWLQRLQEQQLELRQYEYTPLVEIQRWSSIPRGQGLFESIVVFENFPLSWQEDPRGGATVLQRTNYALTVAAWLRQDLTLRINYDSRRFDASTIARMLGHLQTILEHMAAAPEQRLGNIRLLTDAEHQQIVVEWNTTAAPSRSECCLHERIEAQAARTPDAIAVISESQQLTYQELNQRANQLGHYLQSLGVGPEVRVAICMERSPELLIAVLGVLKAGGAYIPLDPAYPQERRAFMLADAQAPVLLTQRSLAADLSASEIQVIDLDDDWQAIRRQSADNPRNSVTPANLAYVIYTSGSTGRPKGVLIPHRGIGNTLQWSQSRYPLTERDRVLHIASFSFDISIWELIGPLLVGAQVIMPPPGAQHDSAYLVKFMAEQQVSIAHFVPSLLGMVLEEPALDACRSLRRVFCGGEALASDLAARFHARLNADLIQLYGPTESSILATHWPCAPEDSTQRIPIGHPISNSQVYLLDRQLRPVPVGLPGELHIGGDGLARGYLNRADQAAEKFIPDPFSRQPGARLYRTGDLARYRADGAIEFLGRIDHQVKIRGFRIELQEIEAVLAQHPAVRQCVVVARTAESGSQVLVAYVVKHPEPSAQSHNPELNSSGFSVLGSAQELRQFLGERLPAHMVPALFIGLGTLPLTANGKVNRDALPMPEQSRSDPGQTFVAPQSAIEQRLADIWASVLRIERVGIHDNFFELGGDSILSIQLSARARQAGLDLAPRQVFDYQTIAELAAIVTMTAAASIQAGPVTGPVPLTPIQHWFFEQIWIERQHFNQSLLLELFQPLELARIEQAIQQLTLHHDALRLRFVETEAGWEQHNAGPSEQPICARFDLSTLSEQAQIATLEATAAELQSSLDLLHGPLLRVALFDRGAKPGWLLLIIHHLVVDGVSWRILLEDFQIAYQQVSDRQVVALPPKTTSFKHWAERLRAYAQTPEAARELDFWLALDRSLAVPLPVDYRDGENSVASARNITVALSPEETQQLLHEVPAAYSTQINDLLLTALVLGCSEWLGERALLLNLEGHGREDLFTDVDLSRTVGWFTSLFPVYLDLSTAWETGDALKATKEQLRAVPGHGIGYGILRYLREEPESASQLRMLPRPEISFNYLGQLDQALPEAASFRLASASHGPDRSLRGQRQHLIDINAFVVEGGLQIVWTYSANLHRHATIEQLARQFIAELQALIAHCLSQEAGGYTPSDFPLIGLDQQQMDQLIARARKMQEE